VIRGFSYETLRKGAVMIKETIKFTSLLFVFLFSIILYNPAVFCQSDSLREGMDLYQQEKYEEAIEAFKKARAEDPDSSVAAFYLGLAYKQTFDYEMALGHFRDAVTLTPRIKEGLIELVDVALQLGEIEEAKTWIGVAEEADILPAKTAFLKGLILREEGRNDEASEAFEKAKTLDPTIAQASDIQIALGHIMERELKKAKERFESAITQDPQSDLAGFARQYLATVEQRIELERPLRFTVGIFGQYDDNMILKPNDETLASQVTNEASNVLNSSMRVNYVPAMRGRWLFSAQYAAMSSLHQKNVHTHDSFSNSITVTPGYNFGSFAVNLASQYNYALVRRPSYKKYSGSLSTGPLFRFSIKRNQLLEIFSGYTNTEYFKPSLAPDEDRDSYGYRTYASWVWLFKEKAFLNLRYQFRYQNTDGQNWDNMTNTFSANLIVPTAEKVKLQLSGQIGRQEFEHKHTTFGVKRDDDIYDLSCGITWEAVKDTTFVAQYSYIRNKSNIKPYDYTRNLVTVGLEYRF
jgi:tetratricopeptide (TPR) repeat protein